MRVVGHRGARGEAPENTLSGFRYLHSLGVRAVEFDVQVSCDGALVVIHDNRLERTTSGNGWVKDYAVEDLAAFDACHGAFPEWPEREGIPSLEQVLDVLIDFYHIELEVKAVTPEDEALVIAQLPNLWERFQLQGRARTTSFNSRYLQGIRESAPHIPRGLLFEQETTEDVLHLAHLLGCSSLGPPQECCDAELVLSAHQMGMIVSTWTVNNVERACVLRSYHVDALITDVPSLMVDMQLAEHIRSV